MNVTAFIVKGSTLKTCKALPKSLPIKPNAQYIFTRDTGHIHIIGDNTDKGALYTMSDEISDKVADHCSHKCIKTRITYPDNVDETITNFDNNMTTIIDTYSLFFDELKAKKISYSITKKQILNILKKCNSEWALNIDNIIPELLDKNALRKYGSGLALTEDAKKYIGIIKKQTNQPDTNSAIEERKNRLRTRTSSEKAAYDKQLRDETIAELKEMKE
jgi:hypothetical protein